MVSYLKPSLFSTPLLASAGTFPRSGSGQGRAGYATTPLPQREFSKQPEDGGKGAGGGAMIKCSDCGKEVDLEQLGDHVCRPPPSPAVRSLQSTSGFSSGERRGLGKAPADMVIDVNRADYPLSSDRLSPYPRTPLYSGSPTSLSSSHPSHAGSSYFPSASSISTGTTSSLPRSASASSATSMDSAASASSRKLPFFEKYAKLVQPGANGSAASSPSTNSPSSAGPLWGMGTGASGGRFAPLSSNHEVLTPDTSPDYSSFPSSIRSKTGPLGQAAQPHRPEFRPRSPPSALKAQALGMAQSRSAGSGLDRLLASEHAGTTPSSAAGHPILIQRSSSLSSGLDERDRYAALARVDTRVPPVQGTASAGSSSSSLSSRWKGVGLEGLMGDLMAEMDASRPFCNAEQAEKAGGKSRVMQSKAERSPDPTDVISFGAYTDDDDSTTTPRPGDVARMPNYHDDEDESVVGPSDSISQVPERRPNDHRAHVHLMPQPRPPPPPPPPLRSVPGPTEPLHINKHRSPPRCSHCRREFSEARQVTRRPSGAQPVCEECYADLYLPKCRKCTKPIEKGAVTDRVGKVLGKYHTGCFNCFRCSEGFPNGEFYVWERKPVCYRHYHQLAGTVCANEACQQGVEGPCVALSLDEPGDAAAPPPHRKLYHPEHFTCSRPRCGASLREYHFVVNGRPWCERHAGEEEAVWQLEEEKKRRAAAAAAHAHAHAHAAVAVASGGGGGATGRAPEGARRPAVIGQGRGVGTARAEKRRTVVKNVGARV